MKRTIIILLMLAGLFFYSCTKADVDEGQRTVLPEGYVAMTLEGVSVEGDLQSVSGASARFPVFSRAGVEPGSMMPKGSRFRLYAFEKGKSSIDAVLSTRTYTIEGDDGLPVMDADQDVLTLPIGDVDIYLVGPVQAMVGASGEQEGTLVEVATPYGVFPRFGVDLIASKTELTVNVKGGPFSANALSHKMSKVEVVAQKPKGANYENLLVQEMTLQYQALESEFKFGDEGGMIVPVSGSSIISSKTPIELVTKSKWSSTFYMIPRPKEEMKLEVFFTCNLVGQSAVIERRLSSGLINVALVAGRLNRFTTEPELSPTLLWRLKLLPWMDIDEGESIIPIPDLVFSYSALDAPFSSNGKMYWRDRSGNGNHAEIVGDMRYDAKGKFYYNMNSSNAHFRIPPLGKLDKYTLEIAAEVYRGHQSGSVGFNDMKATDPTLQRRTLNTHIPWGNAIYFDAGEGANGEMDRRVSDDFFGRDSILPQVLATYYFQHTGTTMSFGRAGYEIKNYTPSDKRFGAFNDNKLWSSYRNAAAPTLPPPRLYAARLYRTNLTAAQLKQSNSIDIAAFTATHIESDPTRQYVKKGLILNLCGFDGSMSKDFWYDRSSHINHAKVSGATYSATPDGVAAPGFIFDPANKAMIQLYPMGALQTFTIEVVVTPKNNVNALICLASRHDIPNSRELMVHLPHDGVVHVQCPLRPNVGVVGLQIPTDKRYFPYVPILAKRYQYVITRDPSQPNDGLRLRQNSAPIPVTAPASTKLREMKYGYIGARPERTGVVTDYLEGVVHAVRIYDRVLTEQELHINYEADKRLYNILP